MFYQTTLKSVADGVAVDVQGKRLSFIGYMPAQAGDTVWTDGNIIFGNTPPKNTPNISAPLAGVPVVGENLTGYITSAGGYREKNIITDDWIVNDNKVFQHGKDYDGQKIIEADIFTDENGEKTLATVTDGFYRKNQCVKHNWHLWTMRHSADNDYVIDSTKPYLVHYRWVAHIGDEITLGIESENINQPIKIYKGDELIGEINLQPYADFITKKVQVAGEELMTLSDNSGVNIIKQPAPPQDFMASAYARPVSFRINQNGDWDAIIFSAAYGYCFPYETMDGSVLEGTFNDEVGATTNFSVDLIKCVNTIEGAIFDRGNYPFLEIEKYPDFTGQKKINDDEYTDAYKRYIENAIDYYIPLIRFKWSMWFTVTFGGSCMLRVHNGEILSVMTLDVSGGNLVMPEIEWDESYRTFYPIKSRFKIDGVLEVNNWSFPITDGYYCTGKGKYLYSIYDGDNNLITKFSPLNLNVGEYWVRAKILTSAYDHEDTHTAAIVKAESLPDNRWVWDRFIRRPARNYVITSKQPLKTVYEDLGETLENYYPQLKNVEDYHLMDGFFDSESDDGFFRFNPAITKLSDGNYLFGIHDGELFVGKDGVWEKIGDKLKNFRLRKMKNLSVAKNRGS